MTQLAQEQTPPATPPPTPGPGTTGWGLTGMLVVLYLLNASDKAVFGLIAQPLREDLDLSASQIGFTGSLFFLAFTVGGFLAGPINKLLALRWSITLIAVLWGLVMLPLVVWATFAVLLLSRMLLGFTEGPTSALLHTAAYSWHPPNKRGLPSGLILTGSMLAKMAVVPLLALVVAEYGWRAAIIVLAAATALWCVPWLLTWRPGPYQVGGKHAAPEDATTEPAVPWRRLLTSKTFVSAVVVAITAYALMSVVLTWLPSYFEQGLGYSRLESGTLFAAPSFVGIATLVGGSWLSDRGVSRGLSTRLVRVVVPCVGVMIAGVLLLSLPVLGSPLLAVIAVSVAYGLVVAIFPLLNAAVIATCPPRQTAGVIGAFFALQAIGGIIGPWSMGIVVDASASKVDGYTAAFQCLGVVGAIAAAAALFLADPLRDRERLRVTR
ncbi:MFS transporter [Nocardia neocaledoniensis NBRC 108232]|uniref:Sugar phosphate permease n=2 Tax=Nocardia neocaledoniensis TaxID=236511 RepID=A0A317N436_9NOCA|nr:sugar phosphate permease [Nocardia neocaledoniensis]GEM29653.1 MFS transporter [Nocardia neocaledoniensis NBRC 108232]